MNNNISCTRRHRINHKYISEVIPRRVKSHHMSDQTRTRATAKLRQASYAYDWPLDDLLDWYRDDLHVIADEPMITAKAYVADYITNHDLCRGTT